MASNRLETLQRLLEQDPTNTFARYGVAMEYVNSGLAEQSLPEFQKLMEIDPNYAAAYFHAGRALESLGKTEEAREIFQRGIAVTTRTGDAHTRSELQAALDMLGI